MNRSPGIRTKLLVIFVFIKVLPLIALAWFAWSEIFDLAGTVEENNLEMISRTRRVVDGVTELSTKNSIRALDEKSREAIERLTTDTAKAVAAFLYDRDRDIEAASRLSPDREQYRSFLATRFRPVILHAPWLLDAEGRTWVPGEKKPTEALPGVIAQNDDNRRDFHYRPPEENGIVENRPVYLEMTFINPDGQEIVKVSPSGILDNRLRNVSDRRNTYCQAETYFQELKNLKPGEIHVSEVIGPYVGSRVIGTYSREAVEKLGIPFEPEKSGYAGKENPLGKRFQGLVRWCAPVTKDGRIQGYVTLALDHTHIMEFTDHVVPTEERYAPMSDAGSGNYAFMWDYRGRNVSHPRDYFIVGFDPETGERAVPWLDEELYELYKQCNGSMAVFEQRAPEFKEPSLAKKPAAELTARGFLGLDGRYLNFAPQCVGWHNLTQHGGSGSFLIFWSGLWKLTTAATIPYYTGIYGRQARGFGYVTIGANVDEFHRPAMETAATIRGVQARFDEDLDREKQENQALMRSTLRDTFKSLIFYTAIMVLAVIFIAIFMAAALTSKITDMIFGIRRFQEGDRSHRLQIRTRDEMGQLAGAFNRMADTVQTYIGHLETSREALETVNERLQGEVRERQQAEIQLSRHRDNLEELVKERTAELEKEIVERKRFEKLQAESEERLRKQNNALLYLASHETIYAGELEASLTVIMETAGRTLATERSSVWLFNRKQTDSVCMGLYVLSANRHSRSGELPLSDYPVYFRALETSRTIAAADACADERMVEFARHYLPALGIRSVLDAAILEGGRLAGFVRFENTEMRREWHIDEQNFANSIADIVALSMGAAKRMQADKTKKDLETRLHQAEKMEAIGTLAGGVAHDLNNILSGLVSYPELMLLKMPKDSPLRNPIEIIAQSGKKAATIVQDLLTLARRGVAIAEIVNLNRIIEEYLQSPEYHRLLSFHEHVRVRTFLEPDLLNISGSPVHLSKALMNLISNAAEAMPDGGDIRVSTENRYVDQPLKGYEEVNEGDYAVLTVADTGVGISPEDLGRIFEPFYTKKKMGKSGTGLGMSVVWGTVKDHRGYIESESRVGRGSKFTLYFPITRKKLERTEEYPLEVYRGGGETVLVVDDVREQREIASAILNELGYAVHTVASGEEAVEYLKDNEVDLLLLDMIMEPGIDGLDTYRKIIEFRPAQKAIIASGFSETDRIREAQRLGVSKYVKKPYTIEKIGLTILEALGKREAGSPPGV
ncbi:MAG: ATP-binding protein [Thermodesulfobacteriota bacterium]